MKFNPWHDPDNGQFTFAPGGFRGGGGRFGGAGASGQWDAPDRPRTSKRSGNLPVVQVRPTVVKPPPAKAPNAEARSAVLSGGYRFEQDSSNRAIRISGTLRLQPDQPRSRRNQRDAGKPDRLSLDHGGHFIAREFGGPEIALNHFAQDARSNRSEYRSLELGWKADLKRGKKISVDIRPSYVGGSRRPESLGVTYYVNGVRDFRRIKNKQGGK